MSRAIASARQRRAGVTQPEPQTLPPRTPDAGSPAGGLTLPQVIALVDTRLIRLEKFMKDYESGATEKQVKFVQEPSESSVDDSGIELSAILDDFNSRFMMLAEEIASLKDTLMKLQTYTMDVNKMLLDERVTVLSDLGATSQSMFVMEDTVVPETEKIGEQL